MSNKQVLQKQHFTMEEVFRDKLVKKKIFNSKVDTKTLESFTNKTADSNIFQVQHNLSVQSGLFICIVDADNLWLGIQ